MVAEEVMVTLSGGAPWGFRLQGGVEQKQPLQVSK
ncbi:synaptopodin 2-like protein, partial [Tachysurus ichikawai]